MLGLVVGLIVAVTIYLIGNMVRSIQDEKRQSRTTRTWRNFGLSIAFCILFLVSWAGHGVAQWQVFTDEQREHGQPVEVGDFTSDFAQATLENWQSEFLQLFSFVVMSALLIHKGSAESKDSDERMEEALKRIERKLGTK
jgi:ABC-type phosphate/phosphonate transport system permease subunit